MRSITTRAALLAAAFMAFAGSPMSASTIESASTAPSRARTSHATRGTVKSVDDTTLVVARSGKTPREMTFELNASTQREGTIAVGAPVSVRYRNEGKTHVATAIRVRRSKQPAAQVVPPAR